MVSRALVVPLAFVGAIPSYSIAQLPDRMGGDETYQWCEKGVASALPSVVNKLMSQDIPLSSARMLINKFNEHFDRSTGDLVVAPYQWAHLLCEERDGRYQAALPKEWPFVGDQEIAHITGNPWATDQFCDMLWSFENGLQANGTLPEGSMNRWALPQGITMNQLVPVHLLPPEFLPYLNLSEWKLETAISVAKVLPHLRRIILLKEEGTLKSRMGAIGNGACRFSDVEATVPGLHDTTPFTCSLIDGILSSIMCTNLATFPRKGLDCSKPSEKILEIRDFPSEFCYAPRSVLQRQGDQNESLRAFKWTDPDLYIELLLEDIRPLPAHVPREIRNKELLTYLALYRANMLIYGALDNVACRNDLPPDFQLVPGWDLLHIVSMQYPRDPIFEKSPSTSHIPLIFISQNSRRKCDFNVAIRGTGTQMEWRIDFTYWESPLVDEIGLEGGKHKGFTDFVYTAGSYVRGALENLSQANNCTCSNTRIILSGHSLGGGVGQLLALHLANLYHYSGDCRVDVSGVFFASPRGLTGDAKEAYRKTVNGRHLIDLSDPLYYLPCHTQNARLGYPRCGRGHINPPGHGRDKYEENDGLVLLDVDFVRSGAKVKVQHMHHSIDPDYVTDVEVYEMLKRINDDDKLPRHTDLYMSADRDRPQITPLVDLTIAESQFSQITKKIMMKVLNAMIPNRSMMLIPTKQEVTSAHMAAFSCALSAACHGLPWGKFRWWCEGMPEGYLDGIAAQEL